VSYITRIGAGLDGKNPELFSSNNDKEIIKDTYEKFSKSPHNFRFIISPKNSDKIDIKEFTKELFSQVEKDLGTKIDWVASIHHDTNDPHIHALINGTDKSGKKLVIKSDYITRGIRSRASQIINNKLGLREWEEVVKALHLEVNKSRKTTLDKLILSNSNNDEINLKKLDEKSLDEIPKVLLEERLVGSVTFLLNQFL